MNNLHKFDINRCKFRIAISILFCKFGAICNFKTGCSQLLIYVILII